MREDLETRVRDQMIGTQASVGIGELRSIRVFVLGDAQTPGSYTVSGLSTITNALFVSGGVKKIGSLRNIQLKRSGRTVTTLDLVRPAAERRHAGRRAAAAGRRDLRSAGRHRPSGLGGEVRRPAIYELKDETTAGSCCSSAAGFTPEADPSRRDPGARRRQRARALLST